MIYAVVNLILTNRKISAVVITTATLLEMKGITTMMYFVVAQEFNAMDLVTYLLGYAEDKSQNILELSQEYQLEEIIVDVLDRNIGENVDPYECILDIEENTNDYIKSMLENVEEYQAEDFQEELNDLGL